MRRTAALFVVILTLLSSCRRAETPETSFAGAPVILISIDTLRSDHLPAYGYRGVETPALDAFRKDGILARSAWSHSPMTLPSHLSMLSGLLPAEHGVRNNIGFRFGAGQPYLPCVMREHGYATGAAVSSYVLRSESGIDRCFDAYDDSIDPRPDAEFGEYQRRGDDTARFALEWIAGRKDQPFFYFFHIYEPHVPYAPPEPYRSRYASAYDGEVAYADAIVGRFLDGLRKLGIYDRALIIVTSDHGEGLGDHGEEQHSILLYREAIQVPLIVKLPGAARAGEEVAGNAGLAQLPATILNVIGINPPAGMNAQSFLARDFAGSSVFSETMYPRIHLGWHDLASLVSGKDHFIQGAGPELYDFVADPAEKKDLAPADRRTVSRMRAAIAPNVVPLAPLQSVDPEAAKRLASLGYVGGTGTLSGALPDPRERIHILEDLRGALELAAAGRHDAAIAQLRAMLEADPTMAEVWLKLAETLVDAGRDRDAIAAYQKVVALTPMLSGDILLAAGYAHFRLGELDRASALAGQAAIDTPQLAHELRARVLVASNRLPEAESEARAAVDEQNPQPSAMLVVAEVLRARGDLRGALETIDAAGKRAADLGQGPVYRLDFLRADTFAKLGRFDEARTAIDREIAAFPSHLEAYGVLAVLRMVEGDRAGAARAMEAMVRANPSAKACEFAAKTMDALDDPASAAAWRKRAAQYQ